MKARGEMVAVCVLAVSWLCACGSGHAGLGPNATAGASAGGAAGTSSTNSSGGGFGGGTFDAGAAGTTLGADASGDQSIAPDGGAPPFTAVGSCSKDGWCWSTPAPQGNTLRSIWGSGATDVWAVGDSGTIVHFDGKTWTQVSSGEHEVLRGVWASGQSDAWAVGDHDVVLHWNGVAWAPPLVRPALRFSWRAVWGTRSDDVWIVGIDPSISTLEGYAGTMMHWDGVAWTAYTAPEPLSDVWGTGPDDVWSLGESAGLFHWDGKTWTMMSPSQPPQLGTSLWGSSARDIWLGARSATRPGHWDGKTVGRTLEMDADIDGLWGSGPNDVWAVGTAYPDWFGDGAVILHWNGIAWDQLPGTGASHLFGVWGSGRDDVWAVGSAGDIVHWDGRRWSAPVGPPHVNLFSVWGSSSEDVWAFGYDQAGLGALHWNGRTWTRTELIDAATIGASAPASTAPYAAWGSGRDDIWVGAVDWEAVDTGNSARSLFVHWDGRAWSLDQTLDVKVAATMLLAAMWGTGPNDVWAVGQDAAGLGEAVHWDGARWSAVTSLSSTDRATAFHSVWSSGPNDVWIGGYMTVLHWNGASWSQPILGVGESFIVGGSGPTDVWAVTSEADGKTVASQWNGIVWRHAVVAGVDLPASLVVISPTNGWLRGEYTIAHWDGKTWTPSDAGTEAFSSNLWWDGQTLWTIVERGLIRHP